jgi:HlyD family secretion protein
MQIVSPHALHERVATEDNPAVRGEQIQQIEFVRGQIDVTAIQPRETARGIDRQPAGRHGRRMRPGGGAAASQQRTHSGDEFADAEGFRQVIVRATVESQNLVRFFATCGQHQDGSVGIPRLAANGPTHGDTVEAGQHQIEDEEIEWLGAGELQCFGSVIDRHGGVSLELEMERDELADVAVVFNDQHARGRASFGGLVGHRWSIQEPGESTPAHLHQSIRAVGFPKAHHRFVTDLPCRRHTNSVYRGVSTYMKRHKALVAAALISLMGLSVGAYYRTRDVAAPTIAAEPVTRGSIVSHVAATATLEAVTTVQVGTQVSGNIQSLSADFNSIVTRGQELARLDPSLFQSAIDQARANVVRAEADRERLKVALTDATVKLNRARELGERQLIPASDLDAADVNQRLAAAQVRSADAQVTQARAALSQAEVNLAKTVITSPIDGIVIARNVDVGQTVAASLQAPTLFVIAADLRQMQLKANIDEADLGSVASGQPVTFTVDAYPNETFAGNLEQVRLNPVIDQNVVTYAAIITAPNPELKLKPGMTANISIEVARRDDVLRVPNAALRFKPTDDALRAWSVENQQRPKGSAVWTYVDGRLTPVTVNTGATDGTYTEVVGGALEQGTRVATRVMNADSAPAQRTTASSPLMPSGPPRR